MPFCPGSGSDGWKRGSGLARRAFRFSFEDSALNSRHDCSGSDVRRGLAPFTSDSIAASCRDPGAVPTSWSAQALVHPEGSDSPLPWSGCPVDHGLATDDDCVMVVTIEVIPALRRHLTRERAPGDACNHVPLRSADHEPALMFSCMPRFRVQVADSASFQRYHFSCMLHVPPPLSDDLSRAGPTGPSCAFLSVETVPMILATGPQVRFQRPMPRHVFPSARNLNPGRCSRF